MRALSAQEVLSLGEWGQDRHTLDRALGFLAVAYPDASWDELARLSIGQRDGRILALREFTVGPRLQGFAECTRCGEQLEFTMDSAELRIPESEREPEREHGLEADGHEVRFRLPNSLDLAAAARCKDPAEAQRALLRRCVVETRRDDQSVEPDSLPESVIAGLTEQMEILDPQADLCLKLACSECGHIWPVLLDIASFFWKELSVLAKRLLREVHALARAYGWREADILAMSPARRTLYLELAVV